MLSLDFYPIEINDAVNNFKHKINVAKIEFFKRSCRLWGEEVMKRVKKGC